MHPQSTSEINIRPATVEDMETLLLFEQGVIYAERPFDPTLRKGVIHYYDLNQMIEDDNTCLLVAEQNNEILASGYARIEAAKPYLEHPRHAYLGFMYVHPGHRGQGIIRHVIEALKNWSLSRHIRELRLDVYFENVQAIRAYEKAGFTKHMVEMRMGIPPE